jgi:hypothetical protein
MYVVNLESKNPEVLEYTPIELQKDLEFFGYSDVMQLNDFDWRVFKTERQADNFLKKYQKTLNSLDNKKICKSRDLPAMLYKRRYIVQTLMREKLQTVRHYKKDWKKGDLFNLHDQSFFVTVELVSLRKIGDSLYEYKFKLPSKSKSLKSI